MKTLMLVAVLFNDAGGVEQMMRRAYESRPDCIATVKVLTEFAAVYQVSITANCIPVTLPEGTVPPSMDEKLLDEDIQA